MRIAKDVAARYSFSDSRHKVVRQNHRKRPLVFSHMFSKRTQRVPLKKILMEHRDLFREACGIYADVVVAMKAGTHLFWTLYGPAWRKDWQEVRWVEVGGVFNMIDHQI
mmetsp:Transcript_37106/g.106870  ORF Transcript_37106/g.106870 Transcript_37106/m.106870 type:complete len:109 (+) Transcript_37106:3212-3538(+)